MEIDLKDLLVLFWRKLWLIAASALAAAAAAFLFTYVCVTPMYTATVSLYVSNNNNGPAGAITTSDLNASQSLVETYIVVLESNTLLEKVCARLPGGSAPLAPETLREMISASAINGTEAFSVQVRHADAAMAQTIANTIADVAPDEIIRVVKAGDAEVIDYAKLPQRAYWPLRRNAAIGGMLGMMVCMAAILIRSLLDVTIHSSEDLTERYEFPVLGVIPSMAPAEEKNLSEKGGQI